MYVLPLLASLLSLPTATPTPQRIVVFPFDAREFNPFRAKEAEQEFMSAMGRIEGLQIIESDVLARELGADLSTEARACNNDVLCLVQLGEILGAERLLLPRLREGDNDTDVLQIVVVDVQAAKLRDSLTWEIPSRIGMFSSAVAAAARHLFGLPDARLLVNVQPKDARLFVFGEEVGAPPYTQEIAFWAGSYVATVERRGHAKKSFRLDVKAGGVTKVDVQLVPDPSYVEETPDGRAVKVRGGSTRSGSGTGDETITAKTEREVPTSPAVKALMNPWAWGLVVTGGLGLGVGGAVMASAQSDYNALSIQTRYSGRTTDVGTARDLRDQAASSHQLGSIVFMAGLGAAGGGLAWLILSSALAKPDAPVKPDARIGWSPHISPEGGGLSCFGSF